VSEKFPHTCCRCGYCCLSETCPVGQMVYGVGKHETCPGLFFNIDAAVCQIAAQGSREKKLVGVGSGCCIKARAIRDGVTYDFAALAPEMKRSIVKTTLQRRE
jgi:hypothetical protein